MKNIILIAAPSAGKGTEAALLKEEYGIPHISTGDILREKAKEDSQLGRDIKYKIDNGIFVSDDLIIEILKSRIQQEDCNNGYILDGFPRDVKQAEEYKKILDELGKDIGIVLVIDVSLETALKRILGRVVCPKCKKVYNTNTEDIKPKIDGMCDDCKIELVKRSDDSEQTYMSRYNTYIEKTYPLIEYYEKQNIVYHIDGNVSIDYTHNQVKKILGDKND